MEIDILKLLSNSSNLKRFSSLIREERFTKTTRFIYQNLEPYFNDTSKDEVDWEEFSTWMLLQHPNMTDEKLKHAQWYARGNGQHSAEETSYSLLGRED